MCVVSALLKELLLLSLQSLSMVGLSTYVNACCQWVAYVCEGATVQHCTGCLCARGRLSMCMPEGFYCVALMLWSKQYYPVIFYSSSTVYSVSGLKIDLTACYCGLHCLGVCVS